MATRYGHQVLIWLVKRGWIAVPIDPNVMGDQQVSDPLQSNKIYDVYTAAKIQRQRTGEYPDFLPKD